MASSVLDLNWGGGFHTFLPALSGPILGNFEGTDKRIVHALALLHSTQDAHSTRLYQLPEDVNSISVAVHQV